MKGHNLPIRPSPQQFKASKEGFADVARWISLDRDNETFIFRKFDELAARNLLYLQAELLVIESKLDKLDQQDALSNDIDVKDVARRWEALEQLDNVDAQARLDLVFALREKLKEYRTLELPALLHVCLQSLTLCQKRLFSDKKTLPIWNSPKTAC